MKEFERGITTRELETNYLTPKQLLGPFENATRYFSRSCESFWSQRSGENVYGSGNISALRCTIVAPIETTVYVR